MYDVYNFQKTENNMNNMKYQHVLHLNLNMENFRLLKEY